MLGPFQESDLQRNSTSPCNLQALNRVHQTTSSPLYGMLVIMFSASRSHCKGDQP
ncbi:hypothetical protein Hanom_Chr05g00385841 [Helianthus anomalus]